MHKIRIHRPGGYEAMRYEECPDPVTGPGEVHVSVHYAGVNFADCVVRMGLYASAREYVGYPITPGFDFAGVVVAVGEGVAEYRAGQRVMGATRFGGYATDVVVPPAWIRPVPSQLTMAQAAGFPAVHLTAWYALCELARPRANYHVLVHSAAGGVGSVLVQIAKLLGARVVGVVGGSHKVDSVAALGADLVIDKSTQDLWTEAARFAPHGYDIVLDANGVETLGQSYRHLAVGGRLVIYGFATMLPKGRGKPTWPKLAWDFVRTPRFDPLSMTNKNRSVLAFNMSYMFDRTDLFEAALGELLPWLESGALRPPHVQDFPLHDAAAAHRALESGDTVGKLVLRAPAAG